MSRFSSIFIQMLPMVSRFEFQRFVRAGNFILLWLVSRLRKPGAFTSSVNA